MKKQSTDDLELAQACLEALPQAMRTIRDRVRANCGRQLTIPQFRSMLRLRRGPATNKQLAEDVGLSVAAMSRLVQQLSEIGFVERSEDKRDRREVWLRLSDNGEEYVRRTRELASRDIALKLANLSPEEKQNLAKGLNIIVNTL